MRVRWLFAFLLVVALAIGVTGGAVLAQDDGAGGDSPLKGLASRMAAILGLDETQVQDAFDQAARENQDEALQRKLDRLVELGRLTQEQADEHFEWYQSRPATLSSGFMFHGFRGHGFHRGWSWGGGECHGLEVPNGADATDTSATVGTTSL